MIDARRAIVVAALVLPLAPASADTATEQELRNLLEQQEQRIKVLERKLEIQDENAKATVAATPVVKASPKGMSFQSADGSNLIKFRGLLHVDGATFLDDADLKGVNGWSLTPGWSYFDDGSGFHMPVPDSWTFTKSGTMYCFRDPEGDRVLSLDTGRNPAGDPVTACRNEAARLVAAGALPGYSQISIETRPLLIKAADWEYQYRDPRGVALHAQTRWFASNGHGYALSWATREIDWTSDLGKINMVLSTFYTDRPS